jgi:hypothetical protein
MLQSSLCGVFLIGVILVPCVERYSWKNNSEIMSDKDEEGLTRCGNEVCTNAYGIEFRKGFSLRELNWAMSTVGAPLCGAVSLDRVRFRALDELVYQLESVLLSLEDNFPLRKKVRVRQYRMFRRGRQLVKFTKCVLTLLKNKQWQMPENCSCGLPEEIVVSDED